MEGLLSENTMEDNGGVGKSPSLSTEPCHLSKEPSRNTDEVEESLVSLITEIPTVQKTLFL